MMVEKFSLRLIAAVAVVALVAAACGNDDDGVDGVGTPVPTAAGPAAPGPDGGADADELVIGSMMPETGSLAFLSEPMIRSIALAVEDIQAAGGNVRLLTGDTGTDPDVASEAINRLLGEGADVIVGAAASGISQSFIQTLYDAQIPQCSPSNTSPRFSTQANAAYYFRTAPPDQAAAPVLANLIAADGATNVAIIARTDDWGIALSGLLADSLDDLGVASEVISYDEEASAFDATVDMATGMGADAVALVSFAEGGQIMRDLLEAGVPASAMYGPDGMYDPGLPELVDPSNPNVADGFTAITVGNTAGQAGEDFEARLIVLMGPDDGVAFASNSYDCVIILALAAAAARATSGPDIIAQVSAVTSGGQKCFSYGECAGLLSDGVDIDYDGVSGPLELDDVGDPSFARYQIGQFRDGELVEIGTQDVNLADPSGAAPDTASAPSQPELVIGRVMPETGTLAFLAPPMVEGARLAVEDIQAAGGDVRLLTGDTGTDPDVASEAVNRLLGEGADVIVGAAASGISQSFIQTLYDAQIPQCSPSNTSPSFSTQDNAAFYFRTVPPDQAVSPIIANVVAADGATNVAIVARADDYGNALADLVGASLDDLGVSSEVISYSPDAPSFDDTVAEVQSVGADAVVLIAFGEGAGIIRGLLEAGVPAGAMYGSDGIFDPGLPGQVDPSSAGVIDGMKVIGAAGGADFSTRLSEFTGGNLIYGGQAYDCVMVMALAALAAGSTAGPDIIAQVQNVTGGGTKCSDYAECAGLLANGTDIDYDGVSGPLDIDDVGDPTWGRYAVAQYQGGELVATDSQDVDVSTLG
ncbi:ABC transporter substrate-binding protein [Candidatus Poriferisocius sp.]|uniref:ABC transporter substrate-binding protein n=1 Tax=Candidatus Poriferisocius sp. TaxID=3101276 RepID=UPI003B01C16A